MNSGDDRGWPNGGRIWFGLGVVALTVVSIGLAISFWGWLHIEDPNAGSRNETIRNLALIAGGVIAFAFAWWRALVAERQADAARNQVATGQNQAATALRALSNERYQRGAEMLGSPTLAVRLGGIYALQQLAEEQPEQYHVQIMRLLCAFVRRPPQDVFLDQPVVIDGEEMPQAIREDAQAALSAIGRRDSRHKQLEDSKSFSIDLHGANLRRSDVRSHLLDGADLNWTILTGADLQYATVRDADLRYADLSSANLSNADFNGSDCNLAACWRAKARRTNLTGANLEGTIWRNAELDNALLSFATLSGADLTGAQLSGTDISGTAFGYGGRRNEDYSGGILMIGQTASYTSVTQEQLDQATASKDCPPEIEQRVAEPTTGVELVWHDGNAS